MRTKREWVNDFANEAEHEILLLEGPEYDSAIVGMVYRFGMEPVVCYDRVKVIAAKVKQLLEEDLDGQDAGEAAEDDMAFNTEGTWAGEGTWAFLIVPDADVLEG